MSILPHPAVLCLCGDDGRCHLASLSDNCVLVMANAVTAVRPFRCHRHIQRCTVTLVVGRPSIVPCSRWSHVPQMHTVYRHRLVKILELSHSGFVWPSYVTPAFLPACERETVRMALKSCGSSTSCLPSSCSSFAKPCGPASIRNG